MPDDKTLLSFIARRYAQGSYEDAATDALFFILSRSDSAKRALSALLSNDSAPLSIAKVRLQAMDAYGAYPDLACLDQHDNIVALIESKFWATLTHHQPVTYWKTLPADQSSVLLFLAPKSRVDAPGLWDALVNRLRDAGHELCPADIDKTRITAASKTDRRRLTLTGWHSLLDGIAQRAKQDSDAQASFEITELQGFVDAVITKGKPTRDENLKRLIADAVNRLETMGWANTDGLSTGEAHGYYYQRYHRLAGAAAALRIDYNIIKQRPDRPLWLRFGYYASAPTSTEQVRGILKGMDEEGWDLNGAQISMPITLPTGADHDTTLGTIVAQMERIAKIIDPNGPTYQK